MSTVEPQTPTGATPATGHALAAELTPVGKLAEKLLARAGVLDSAAIAIHDQATAARSVAAYVRHTLAPKWDALQRELAEVRADLSHTMAVDSAALRESASLRDHYRRALEAIAASDGTCGAKAREALEATP